MKINETELRMKSELQCPGILSPAGNETQIPLTFRAEYLIYKTGEQAHDTPQQVGDLVLAGPPQDPDSPPITAS